MKIEKVLTEKICPICGKLFIPAPEHTYKVAKGGKVCSWACVRKYEKDKAK